jgi:hypothetical protein
MGLTAATSRRNGKVIRKMQAGVFSRWLCLGTLLAVCGSVAGCGKGKDPWEKVYKVRGVVNLDGKPAGGALITFLPQDQKVPSSVRPSAIANWDGTFDIGTYGTGDGAPAGTYKVVVVRFPVIGSPSSPAPGPNDLPPKYSKPDTTDLTVQVKDAETELPPLELKS